MIKVALFSILVFLFLGCQSFMRIDSSQLKTYFAKEHQYDITNDLVFFVDLSCFDCTRYYLELVSNCNCNDIKVIFVGKYNERNSQLAHFIEVLDAKYDCIFDSKSKISNYFTFFKSHLVKFSNGQAIICNSDEDYNKFLERYCN